MKAKWNRARRNVKKFWNIHLRPKIEPAFKMFVIKKATKAADKHFED